MDRGGTRGPLLELTLARLREFVREPEALFWAFVFPILMSVALAVAFPGGGDKPVLVGLIPGARHDAVRDALEAVPLLRLRDLTPADATRALREGEVHVVVEPDAPPIYRFDPDRQESRLARMVVDDALERADGRRDRWSARLAPVHVAGSRYVDWLIPGLIGMNIMGSGMWGIGFSITQARMRHLLKRLVAGPMRRRDYLLAQMLARLVLLAPEVLVPLGFGVAVLGMPMAGSVVAIASVCLVGALAFAALGLLAASRARTFEAIGGILNLCMLPMWVTSGVFFSAANFPDAAQPFVQALPLTALVDALRAVILDGAGLPAVGGELAILTAWTVAPFGLALALFRWR